MTAPNTVPFSPPPLQRYEEALAFMDSLDVSAMKLGLERIERLLASLGNPQDQLPMVHVGGTNGKGSTVAMLSAILKAAGLTVGTFTSPHLVHVRERITLNGNPILPDDFTRLAQRLRSHLYALGWAREDWPTYFEFINIMAYLYFQEKGVDITVFEVGLGGRLDSTNVVRHPNLTVITGISLEHTHLLGDTLAAIAGEKAGIFKPGTPTVLGPDLPEEARAVFLERTASLDIPVAEADMNDLALLPEADLHTGLTIQAGAQQYQVALPGPYQLRNVATVLSAVQALRQQGWEISEEAVRQGFRQTHWPARFQYFPERRVILDGSHNPEGFRTLQEAITRYLPSQPTYWLLSLRNNRDPQGLLEVLQAFSAQTRGVWITQGEDARLFHAPTNLCERLRPLLPA